MIYCEILFDNIFTIFPENNAILLWFMEFRILRNSWSVEMIRIVWINPYRNSMYEHILSFILSGSFIYDKSNDIIWNIPLSSLHVKSWSLMFKDIFSFPCVILSFFALIPRDFVPKNVIMFIVFLLVTIVNEIDFFHIFMTLEQRGQ